jgi:hypothetical protein
MQAKQGNLKEAHDSYLIGAQNAKNRSGYVCMVQLARLYQSGQGGEPEWHIVGSRSSAVLRHSRTCKPPFRVNNSNWSRACRRSRPNWLRHYSNGEFQGLACDAGHVPASDASTGEWIGRRNYFSASFARWVMTPRRLVSSNSCRCVP